MRNILRRNLLRTAASAATVGSLGAIAGCSQFSGDGEQAATGPWLLEPGTLNDSRETYTFEVNSLAANADVADALPERTRELVMDGGDWIENAVDAPPSQVDAVTIGAVQDLDPTWTVAAGSFSPSPASTYESDGTHAGYDIYASENTYLGVTEGQLVSVGLDIGTTGTREMLTTAIDAVESDTDGFADTDDGFYLDHIGDHTFTYVDPITRVGKYYTLGSSTTDLTLVVEESDTDVSEYESVEDWLGPAQAVREHASDVEFSTDTDTSTVQLSGTVPTEAVTLRLTDLIAR